MKMKAHGQCMGMIYKDTTPFDDGGDDNLLDVQVKESVLQKYMEKNGLGDEWLETYTLMTQWIFMSLRKTILSVHSRQDGKGGKLWSLIGLILRKRTWSN